MRRHLGNARAMLIDSGKLLKLRDNSRPAKCQRVFTIMGPTAKPDRDQLGRCERSTSNLSRSALDPGIEWNLRVDRDRNATVYARIWDAFEATWRSARPLDAAWIQDYAARVRANAHALPNGEVEADILEKAPEAHEVQLEALEKSRNEGRSQCADLVHGAWRFTGQRFQPPWRRMLCSASKASARNRSGCTGCSEGWFESQAERHRRHPERALRFVPNGT